MNIDWDPEIDTPATVAIVGGGPIGVEAALYARFLGYFVMLFDATKVGDSLLGWGDRWIPTPGGEPATWGDVASKLGLAALEAQTGAAAITDLGAQVTYRQYVERYLLPLARTDLLYESTQIHSTVKSISRLGCTAHSPTTNERRGEQEFRLLIESKNRGEYSQLADIILDCSGTGMRRSGLATGGGLAIGELASAPQMLRGKRDILGKAREKFAGKHCLLFGSDLAACANALDLAQLSDQVPGTRCTWIVPKRIDASGLVFDLPENLSGFTSIGEQVQELLNSDPLHLVALAAWGIEALRCEEGEWAIQLQNTEEETLDIKADVFVNCTTDHSPPSFAATLGAHCGQNLEVLTAEPHYYVLGQRAAGAGGLVSIADGLQQICKAFAWIGGRKELNLYQS